LKTRIYRVENFNFQFEILEIFRERCRAAKDEQERNKHPPSAKFRQAWRKNFDLPFEKGSPLIFLLLTANCDPESQGLALPFQTRSQTQNTP